MQVKTYRVSVDKEKKDYVVAAENMAGAVNTVLEDIMPSVNEREMHFTSIGSGKLVFQFMSTTLVGRVKKPFYHLGAIREIRY